MVAPRRYNQEQVDRVVRSGEKPPEDMSLIGRIARNALVAVPRAFTDLETMVGMAVPAVKAGLSSEVDFQEALLGEEGVNEFNAYVQGETTKLLTELPEDRRTDRNAEAIAAKIANSEAAEAIRLKHSNAAIRMGTKASNAINDAVGLGPVREETIVDDASQIAATALVPTSILTRPLMKAGNSLAARALRGTANALVPGNTGTKASVALNTAVPLGLTQGGRALADMPSVVTGDALAADMGVTAAYDPDPVDPEAGMNGEQLAASGAVMGGIGLAAAVLLGKANKVATKALLDQINDGKVPDAEQPLPPTLSKGQKIKSEVVDSSSPLRDTISNAYGKDAVAAKSARDNVDRVITETAHVNMNTAHVNAMQLGNIPGLDRKTVPLVQVERAIAELPQPEIDIFNRYMVTKTLLDRHALKVKSAEEEAMDLSLGIKTGSATMKQFKGAKKKLDELKNEDVAALSDGMSVKQGRDLVAQVSNNPQLMRIESQLRKLGSDILDAKVKDGQLTQAAADKIRAAHPHHMMLQEDPLHGKSTMGVWWEGAKAQLKGTEPITLGKLYGNVRGPLMGSGTGVDPKSVTNPMSALNSYKQYLYDHIQYTKHNDATRTYVNEIKAAGDMGRSIREIANMSIEEYGMKGIPAKIKDAKNKFAYTENGRIHFLETADPETLRALQFSPPSTLMGMNFMRKQFQMGTTGIPAPEFGPTAALYEDIVARTTRQPGRSYGIFDATLRRAFPNSEAVSRVLDTFGGTIGPINTSQIQMVAGLFQQIRYNDLRNAGMKIAADLEQGSGIFSMLAKVPGGKEALQRASEAFLRSYNESRYGQFVNLGIKQSNLLDDPLKQVRNGYEAASYVSQGLRPISYFAGQYKNMLEMVHNTSKYAFFAQNYAALERKYGGKVPKAEAEKLASEVKSLSGDMTRSVGNPYFGKVLSTVPYGQIAVNSTYHLASAIKHDPATVGARILTGVVVPKIAAIGLISSIPALSNWYWNEIPAWQRMSKIPVIGPDWWIDQANGKQRELTPNDIYLMPEAPEMTLISNPMVTFLRAIGAFGGTPEATASFAKELGEGMEGVTSIATPPLIGGLAAGMKLDLGRIITSPLTGKPIVEEAYNENPHQGGNPTGLNADSDISRAFAHGVTALFGVAVGNLLNSADVAMQSAEKDEGFAKAFSKAFEYQVYQSERRLPEVTGAREAGAYLYTDGQRRHYASNQRRERVVKITQAFEDVAKQLGADKDRSGANAWAEKEGLEGLKKIADPQVRELADVMYKQFRTGKMIKLQNDRSELNKRLARVEANKENISPRQYHQLSNGIQTEINDVNKKQEETIMQLESALLHRYGLGIEDAMKMILGSVSH